MRIYIRILEYILGSVSVLHGQLGFLLLHTAHSTEVDKRQHELHFCCTLHLTVLLQFYKPSPLQATR